MKNNHIAKLRIATLVAGATAVTPAFALFSTVPVAAIVFLLAVTAPYAWLVRYTRAPISVSTVSVALGLGHTVTWTGLAPLLLFPVYPLLLLTFLAVPWMGVYLIALICTHAGLLWRAAAVRKTLGGGIDKRLVALPAAYAVAVLTLAELGGQVSRERREAATYAAMREELRLESEARMARLGDHRVVWSTSIPGRFPVPSPRAAPYAGASQIIPVPDGFIVGAYQTVARIDTSGRILWWQWLPLSQFTHLDVSGDTVRAGGFDKVTYRIVKGAIVGPQPPDSLAKPRYRDDGVGFTPGVTCAGGWAFSATNSETLNAQRGGERRSLQLSGNVRGPVCSKGRLYVLVENVIMTFESPFNLVRTDALYNLQLGLSGRDTVIWRSASLIAANDDVVVLDSYPKWYVVREGRLLAVLDNASAPARAVYMSDYLYRLVPDSVAWRLEAIALPSR